MSTLNTVSFKELVKLHKSTCFKRKPIQIKSGIQNLDRFMNPLDRLPTIIEWGCPHGSFGRIIPAVLAKSTFKSCLWIFDQKNLKAYPSAWADIGFDLKQINFINANKPFDELKPIFNDNSYDLVVIDSEQFIKKSDFKFLLNSSSRRNFSIFFIRHFYLSNRNGNPFSRLRLNCSYNLLHEEFKLNFIKGSTNTYLKLKESEVFNV